MGISILIVDDEESVRNSLCAYFKLEELDVDTAGGCDEAISKLSGQRRNVVLLDINMPGKDGLETLKRIKSMDASIQVIIMTAFSTFEKTMALLESGADDYILKPFEDLSELMRLVTLADERFCRWKRSLGEEGAIQLGKKLE